MVLGPSRRATLAYELLRRRVVSCLLGVDLARMVEAMTPADALLNTWLILIFAIAWRTR